MIQLELSTLNRTLLFDTYGELLTEKQRLCFDLRYNQDYSLGEIGELEGISRQAVRDNIVRSEAQLLEFEEKVGAVRRLLQVERAGELLRKAADEAERLGSEGKLISAQIGEALRRMEE